MTGRHRLLLLALAWSGPFWFLGPPANAQGENPWADIAIRHPDARELRVTIGCGDPADPIWMQTLWDGDASGQEVLHIGGDLTSASEYLPPDHKTPWWVEVTDSAAGKAGRIGAFIIWWHGLSYSCTDVPVPIPDGSGRALATITHWSREWENRELIWATVNGTGYPGATPPAGPAIGPFNISEYFPLDEGNMWCYDKLSWHGYGENPWDVYDTREFDGVTATGIRWQGAETGVRYYAVSPEGLAFYGVYHPEGGEEPELSPDGPLVVPNGLSIGDSGSQTLGIWDDSEYLGEFTSSYRLAAVENITAPAGVFENCLKLEFIQEFDLVRYPPTTTPGPWLITEWYAYGIGIIKRDERVLPPGEARFPDVPMDQWAFGAVDGCVNASIVGGYGDGLYRPERTVTRDQMAVFMSRALAGGDANVPTGPAVATFPDVPTDHWACKYVEYCYTQGVAGGYWDGTYRPDLAVNRDAMAVYVARAIVPFAERPDLPSYDPPETPTFPDVSTSHWGYKYIEYCHDEDVVQGYWDGTYRPGLEVNRDAMAVYVARAFRLPMPYAITDYWPWGEGDSWVWQRNAGTHSQIVSGTQEIGGRLYVRVVYPSGKVHYYQNAADGMRHAGWDDPVDGEIRYDPPRHVPNGLYPGDVLTLTNDVYDDEVFVGQVTVAGEFLGFEDITVPAGTFLNCLKFVGQENDYPGESMEHHYIWLASGVGEVRSDERPFGGSGWSELVSAVVGGVTYP